MRKKIVMLIIAVLASMPALTSAETFTRNLSFGMRNDPDVERLQEFLRGQGYFSYPVSTGNYGPVTILAVKKFQQANGLPMIGGYFGPESRRAANAILAARVPAQSRGAGDQPTTLPQDTNLIPIPFLLESPRAEADMIRRSTPAQILTIPSPAPLPSDSPYRGRIAIASVQWFGAADFQNIIISNRARDESISITGFTIDTTHGQSYMIPVGFALPGLTPAPSDPIVLRPGEYAQISAGRQERQMNFRQNLCTGYFDETSKFNPSLTHQCPTPDTRSLRHLSQACANAIQNTPACRMGVPPQFTEQECSSYMTKNLNYVGCVANYRGRTDFYSDSWLVWMQRKEPFFHQRFDTVTLKDPQGRVVDTFDYAQ